MGDHQACATMPQPRGRPLQEELGAGINRTGGLIEDQHGWVSDERARDANQLSLALAQASARTVDHRVAAFVAARVPA